MHSAIQNTYAVQGKKIHLYGDLQLIGRVSDYLCLLYQGNVPRDAKPLQFELSVVEEVPNMPSDAFRIIEGPYISHFTSGEKILFVSKDGTSLISLDPVKGEAKGFIHREISQDADTFYSLVGSLLIETFKYEGLYFLHGACVYGNGKAYLFTGDSGAGKTTAAFSLVRQGFQYVSDDSLFFSERKRHIAVSPLYTHFHADENLGNRFPEISGGKKLQNFQEGIRKVRVNMSELYPDSFVPSLIPDYIIFPQILPLGESSLSPLNQMEVYTRLLKQTVLAVDTHISRNQLKALEKLVKQVRGFELITGQDMYEDPKILSDLLCEIESENGNSQEIQS